MMRRALFTTFTCLAFLTFAEPVRIILDTDISGDYDDIGAMATLFNLEAEGRCQVLGIASSSSYPWSVPLAETIARSFGRGDLPIARSVPGTPQARNWEKVQFSEVVCARFAHPRFAATKDAAEPVAFYRDILSAQPDGSVTLCIVGWASNLAALLKAEGGRDLVARKVAKLVWMAGREKGGRECNFMRDVKASKRVLADFPRPIVLSMFEIGSRVFTGRRLVKELGADDPVRQCYATVFAQSPAAAKRGRESWDQTAVWYAVHGDDDLFRAVRGTIAATDDAGTNSWTDDPNGPHARLEFVATPEQVAACIEDYMVRRAVPRPATSIRSPVDGATVPLLTDLQRGFVLKDRAERRAAYTNVTQRKTLAAGGWHPRAVLLSWTPGPDEKREGARYAVDVRRAKDGLAVAHIDTTETSVTVDNLEIATEYAWSVAPVVGNAAGRPATGRFRTEDVAPRLLRIGGVYNARDLGGRRGLGGRRVRQGLIFRTGGLNEEATRTDYTKDELVDLDTNGVRRARSSDLDRMAAEWEARVSAPDSFSTIAADVGHEWTVFSVDDAVLADEEVRASLSDLRQIPSELFGVKARTLMTDAKGTHVFSDNVHGTQVLCRSFESPDEGWTLLGASGDWYWDLRVNGELVADFRGGNNGDPADAAVHPFPVRLKKGRNLIVAVLKHGMGGCTWSCRALPADDRVAVARDGVAAAKALKAALWTVMKSLTPGRDRVTDEGRAQMLDGLGIRTEIDLRTPMETGSMTVSPLGRRCHYVNISSSAYAGMSTASAHEAFARSFRLMLDPANYGIVFHCAAGQDRTGALAFMVLGLLGVSEEELYRDWEATAFWNPHVRFCHANLFDHLIGYVKTLPGRTLTEKVESYVRACGFSDKDIARFRSIMLEDLAGTSCP